MCFSSLLYSPSHVYSTQLLYISTQKYGAVIGVDLPDIQDESKTELKSLGAELAAEHAMEKVAKAMGKDLTKKALMSIRDRVGDVMLRRIGIEPSEELDQAFSDFSTEAVRFIGLSRQAMEAQGVIDPATEESFMNVTRTADRIAQTMERVNVTDVLMTATSLMIEAEPYLTDAIENPVDEDTRVRCNSMLYLGNFTFTPFSSFVFNPIYQNMCSIKQNLGSLF